MAPHEGISAGESNGSCGMLRTGFAGVVIGSQGALVEGGDPLRLGGVGTGGGDEDGLAVVAQLLDALADVGEGAVVAALGRRVVVGAREPAPGELLDRGDVDD